MELGELVMFDVKKPSISLDLEGIIKTRDQITWKTTI